MSGKYIKNIFQPKKIIKWQIDAQEKDKMKEETEKSQGWADSGEKESATIPNSKEACVVVRRSSNWRNRGRNKLEFRSPASELLENILWRTQNQIAKRVF